MFKSQRKKNLSHIFTIIGTVFITAITGCGQRGVQVSEFSSERGYCQDADCTDGPIQAQSVPTVAVLSASQVLRSWESCLGVTASATAVNRFNANARTIFPAEGDAKAATGPVMLQAMTLAGDLCTTLIQQEAALSAADRKFFNSVDLGSRENPFTRDVVTDVVARFSRACYGRRPASEDTDESYRAMIELGAVTNDGNNKARTLATMLCTGLMASTSGMSF